MSATPRPQGCRYPPSGLRSADRFPGGAMSVKTDGRRIRVVRWTAPALAVLLAMSSQAWAATTDPFSSSELSGYAAGGASGWYVTNEQLAHTYTSNTSFVELVRPAETPRAEADLTLSTGRANAGLTVLWKDHSNHLWAKLEITPGNPTGSDDDRATAPREGDESPRIVERRSDPRGDLPRRAPGVGGRGDVHGHRASPSRSPGRSRTGSARATSAPSDRAATRASAPSTCTTRTTVGVAGTT